MTRQICTICPRDTTIPTSADSSTRMHWLPAAKACWAITCLCIVTTMHLTVLIRWERGQYQFLNDLVIRRFLLRPVQFSLPKKRKLNIMFHYTTKRIITCVGPFARQ